MAAILFFLWVSIYPGLANANIKTYDDVRDEFYMLGDINLGFVTSLLKHSSSKEHRTQILQAANAVIFRVN